MLGLSPLYRNNKISKLNFISFLISSIGFISIATYYRHMTTFNFGFVNFLSIKYMQILNFTSELMTGIVYFFQYIILSKQLHFEIKVKNLLLHINEIIALDTNTKGRKEIIIYSLIVIVTNFIYEFPLFIMHFFEQNSIILAIFYILPTFVASLLTDYYCGGILLAAFYLKAINTNVMNVIDKIKHLIDRQTKKNQNMQEFCDLSDRLDEMQMFHRNVCTMTMEWNRLWSMLTLIYIIWRLFLMVMELYYIFIVMKLSRNNASSEYDFIGMGNGMAMFLVVSFVYSLVKISFCCQKVINEVINL